jgi:hypothetical protein
MQRFGALDRQLRTRFARGERELPLLKAIKGAILAARPPESGECRLIPGSRDAANPEPMNTGLWNMGSGLDPSGRPGMTT